VLLNRPRAAGAALLVVLAAAPVAALVPRVEKAHLAFDPVPVAAGPGSDARFTAVVTIDAGWHAQAHVPTYDYLIPTVLGFDLPPGFGEAAVDYPKPTLYKFEFADEQLAVYEGTVALDVRLPVPAGTSGTLEIPAHLRYQACNDRQCLPPVDATATVKLVVGAGGGAAAAAPDASPPDTESAPHTATGVPKNYPNAKTLLTEDCIRPQS